MKLSKVWKDMGLQKRITEKERGPDPTLGMQLYYVIFIDKEPSSYEEAAEQKEWKHAMIEEYQEEYREKEEPQKPVDPPQERNPQKRKPTWV